MKTINVVLILLYALCVPFTSLLSQETIVLPPAAPATVTVPKVIGLDRAEAEKILLESGLKVSRIIERETRFPDGRVLRQQPAQDAKVSRGSGVILVVSKRSAAPPLPKAPDLKSSSPAGTPGRKLPDVTGMMFSEAYQQLRRSGFSKVQPQPVKSSEARETVIGVLANGEEVIEENSYATDTPVTLLVSRGAGETEKPPVPKQEVTEKKATRPAAKDVCISNKMFETNFVQIAQYFKQTGHEVDHQVVKSEKPKGLVVAILMNGKSLMEGDRVPVGQGVTLELSGGKAYKPPDRQGQLKLPEIEKNSVIDLVHKLKEQGLDVSIDETPSQAPDGTVTGVTTGKEKLQGGEPLPVGAKVNIQVSGGNKAKAQLPPATTGDAPIILEFGPDTANLLVGHSTGQTTLSWVTALAEHINIVAWMKGENGKISKKTIYDRAVPEAFGTTLASQPGQTTCNVLGPTVFSLTASNAAGAVKKTTQVTVTAPPLIAYFDEGTGHADRPVQPAIQEQSFKDKLHQPMKGPHADVEFTTSFAEDEPTTTLTWDIRNLGNHGMAVIQPNVGQVASQGTVTVPIAAASAYVLIAHNAAGVDSAIAYVDRPKPQIHHFGANANPLAHVGDTTHISWRVVGADQIRLMPDGRAVEATGAVDLGLMEPTTFTLIAQNEFGVTQKEITVDIADYKRGIYLFTADPEQISVGERSVLHAIVLGLGETGRVQFSSDPHMPEINAFNMNIKPVDNMDFGLCVHPQQRTQVKMRVIASDDYMWEKSVEIDAGTTPIIASFGTKNAHIVNGHVQGTMYWRVNKGTRATITPDIGDIPLEGERLIGMDSPRLYTLTAYGDPSSIVIRDTLWTGNEGDLETPPAIFTFTATPEIVKADARNVRLTWEARGISARISAYRDGNEVQSWENLPVNGHLDVDPEATTVYSLKVTSLSGLSHRSVVVEMLQTPAVQFVAVPDTVIVGSSIKLIWKVDNLGSSGSVSIPGYPDLPPQGYQVLTPAETQTYTITAANSAGTARKNVTVHVRPPAPYFTLAEPLAAMAIRDSKYHFNMDVFYADSVMVLEVRSDGKKIILQSMQCSPSGKLNRKFDVLLLKDYPIDHQVNTTLEIKLFQRGEWISQQLQIQVLPNIDLQIEPSFSWDSHQGFEDGIQSGYNIYVDIRLRNAGRDAWRAATVEGAQKAKVIVQFPQFNLDNYSVIMQVFGPDITTGTTIEVPADIVLGPGAAYNLHGHLTLPAFNDGTFEANTMVDSENLVWEANESNNAVSTPFSASFETDCVPIEPLGSVAEFCLFYWTLSFPSHGI